MDTLEQVAMKIIASSSEAMSEILKVFECAKKGDFEEAENHIKKTDEYISEAHKAQTNLIMEEANGNKSEYSILMVHAQDHLMNVMLTRTLIKEMLYLYRKVDNAL